MRFDIQKIKTRAFSSDFSGYVMGLAASGIVTLLLTCIYVLTLLLAKLPESSMIIAAQIIKAISVMAGGFIAAKKLKTKGWLRGVIIGIIYVLFGFIIHGLSFGEWASFGNLLTELLQGTAAGALGGIISVNLRKKT